MPETPDLHSRPGTATQGKAVINLETCIRCFSQSYSTEMRDAHWPALREAYGEWRVCDDCGYEWPVERLGALL